MKSEKYGFDFNSGKPKDTKEAKGRITWVEISKPEPVTIDSGYDSTSEDSPKSADSAGKF